MNGTVAALHAFTGRAEMLEDAKKNGVLSQNVVKERKGMSRRME